MGAVTAIIAGTSSRNQQKSCANTAKIDFAGSITRTVELPNPGEQPFAIVDFSADGKKLLLSVDIEVADPDYDRRNVEIATLELANSEMRWVNTWDIFGWHECDATVEPQGFTRDGGIILLARPSTWVDSKRPNCVSDWGLYRTDLATAPVRLADDTKVPRFGKVIAEAAQACKTDPDIIGACFRIHGRLSAWNGSPTMRIWRVGTKRILGVHDDDPLPENLAREMDWGVEAWGDFEVCPYTTEKPGAMQTVCVESAEHVFYKKYK
jgi:hypothetical protein